MRILESKIIQYACNLVLIYMLGVCTSSQILPDVQVVKWSRIVQLNASELRGNQDINWSVHFTNGCQEYYQQKCVLDMMLRSTN